jgi:UDP-glucose 4-epimerase
MFEMGRILITGGSGFIGSHLAERLVKEGYKVYIIDNLLRGNLINLSHVWDEIEFINGDIRNYQLMSNAVRKADIIIHLAAISRVMPSIKKPELCFEINTMGTEIVARLCAKYNKKLIFSSSREVYGTPQYLPVDEDHPLIPENPYGASKIAAEGILKSFSKCYNLSYIILRLTNVFGPRDFDRVVPIFIEKSIKNEDLIIYGYEKVMDFIYISDVTEAFIKSLNTNETNLTLNIGSGVSVKLLDIAKLIRNTIGGHGKLIIKKARKGEVVKFVANIKRAKSILGWEPKIPLEVGIKEILNCKT